MRFSIEPTSSFDLYDIWAIRTGLIARKAYYEGRLSGIIGASAISLIELFSPQLIRRLLLVEPQVYPILSAHVYMTKILSGLNDLNSSTAIADLKYQAIGLPGMAAWGLGFPWMSKNGLYERNTPFVTHTPYVMEALLFLAKDHLVREEAMLLFNNTWEFLESLKVMEETDTVLALSYAPVIEPRIVVNANSYSALAYALHASYGKDEWRTTSHQKALRLARWVVSQQNEDGSWFYYADKESGNFIDCFHSCFVVKNLLKVGDLIPDCKPLVNDAIDKGWSFIRDKLFDRDKGLCRRFVKRAHRDLFKWDLYDQAEYFGLLVDFGLLEEASGFSARVERLFRKDMQWYCRIDVLGRCWGKDFLRWGIAPFQYHKARLRLALEARH